MKLMKSTNRETVNRGNKGKYQPWDKGRASTVGLREDTSVVKGWAFGPAGLYGEVFFYNNCVIRHYS